mgnify:CR=1 FL=1
MVKTKGIERSVSNWKGGVAGASGRYTEGINATTGFLEAALKGEEAYKREVTVAANEGRRAAGLQKAGEAKWKDKASKLGPSRWSAGVNAAEADYRKGLQPVLTIIESVVLPDKTGDARTDTANRSGAIAEALQRAKREGRL